jgi:hypothetical protein
MGLKREGENLIELAHHRVLWVALMNTVINILVQNKQFLV